MGRIIWLVCWASLALFSAYLLRRTLRERDFPGAVGCALPLLLLGVAFALAPSRGRAKARARAEAEREAAQQHLATLQTRAIAEHQTGVDSVRRLLQQPLTFEIAVRAGDAHHKVYPRAVRPDMPISVDMTSLDRLRDSAHALAARYAVPQLERLLPTVPELRAYMVAQRRSKNPVPRGLLTVPLGAKLDTIQQLANAARSLDAAQWDDVDRAARDYRQALHDRRQWSREWALNAFRRDSAEVVRRAAAACAQIHGLKDHARQNGCSRTWQNAHTKIGRLRHLTYRL